jgi:hypothetical protein
VTIPNAPLTSPAWIHKLEVNMMCWPIHNKIFWSNWWSSSSLELEELRHSMMLCTIGMFNDFTIFLLCCETKTFVANRCMVASKDLHSIVDNDVFVWD